MNTPKIRFPGFKNSWNNSILGEIVSHKNDFYKPNKKESLKCIELENLNKNTGTINGYFDSNTQKSIKNVFVEGDILYGKLRPYLKKYWYANFNGICSSEIWVIRSISKKLNSKFLYNFIQTDSFTKNINLTSGTKMPRANWNIVKELILHYPSQPEEQQKIGDFFMLLDKRIEQQEEKIALLKDYKKAMIQRIFSQKIRFKDQNGNDYPDWEEKKLGEICRVKSSQLTNNVVEEIGKYPVYGANSIVGYTENYEVDEYVSIVKDGAVGRIAFINNKSSVLGTLQYLIGIEITTEFLYVLLSNVNFKLYQTGTTIPHIYFKDYSKMIIDIPCQLEQEKISSFLFAMDLNLENQEAILNNLKEQKQGLLRKMFV